MFIKEDLIQYRQFKAVLRQGDFQIKGNAVIPAATLFMWYDRLEKKIEDALKEKKGPSIKPVESK